MEIGEELKTWLQDKSKEYTARLEFAIKVWQSVDFVYINKYEVVCQWLTETIANTKNDLPVAQLQQLFRLRAQPGLVNVATKSQLIQTLLDRINKESEADAHGHAYPQLLQNLINFELVQDALRADYDLLMSSYGTLFNTYERQLINAPSGESQLPARHADFMLPLLQQLRDYVQRAQHHDRLLAAYTKAALHPLCQLILQLQQHNLCCFEQLAAVEQQLTETLEDSETLQRLGAQPLHVQMLLLEAFLYNRRFDPHHLHFMCRYVFTTLVNVREETQPKLVLPLATHALESMRKHNITLQFPEDTARKPIDFLAYSVMKIVGFYRKKHFAAVLRLLCVALRLNPLILEPNVYQITVWMLTANKQNDTELRMYSDYLVLLLDMFRRLSRAERFVMQLLKSLREWLQQFKLTVGAKDSKRSRKEEEESQLEPDDSKLDTYVQLIYKTHLGAAESAKQSAVICFSRDPLAQSWPTQTAGAAFTRLISHLMSKPSMVIWKMLLHSFAELLEPETKAVLPANLNYAIELQATLLSQYLLGTRLAEQVQQFQPELQQQREHTVQVLQQFGRHLLAQEHNRRTMNVFLECVERACSFELLLAYYWPDGLPATEAMYKFLPSDEWELIQQRVHNFGKSLCRQRLQRLELQLVQAGWLLLPDQRGESCPDALVELVPSQLLFHLTRAQKQLRLQQCQKPKDFLKYVEDEECVELLTLQLLQQYVAILKASKVKGALLPKQLPDGEESLDEATLASAIRKHSSSSKQPALPVEETAQLVDALQQLPLAQLVSHIKCRLWLLLFTLYQDVRRAQLPEQEQEQLANRLLEQLIDLLHFGQPLPICSYFPQLEELLQLVPISAGVNWRFYETFFARCIRRLTAGSDVFLTNCAEYFRQQLQLEANKLPAEQCRLLLLAIETLSSATGAQARRMQRYLQPLLEIYGQFVAHKFRSVKKPPSAAKEFVQETLSGFAIYLSSCINRANKQQQVEKAKQTEKENKVGEEEEEAEEGEHKKKKQKLEQKPSETATPIDENLRRICKIYIGHSLNYRNAHAIRLLNVALTHRQQLHLDQDEIEFVLNSYWRQLNADIASESTLDIQAIEPAIKLIIGYKTNEDFLLLLRRLSTQLDAMQRPETEAQHTSLQNVLILLSLFSKCSLSSIKGAMLNEHFELISGNVTLRLPAQADAAYRSHVMRLLEAQRALAGNRTIPLTGETLDCMLGTMLDVNIKRYVVNGGTWQDFVQLHGAISENCLLLLRQHASLMSDRAAQLTALCQDLIHAIISYRSERKQAQNLKEEELDGLAELALKLVTLMAGIAAGPQALAVKRVAPFLLIYTIKQMVTTERPTTLYEKIKVHLDRICHELIGICDHRSGHFILRASNEAGARIYQNLVKEHDKYHKFRGKV